MIPWTWEREKVSPADVLDAARTIPVTNNRITMNLTWRWVPARRYLEWAREALKRGDHEGWDTASSLAKRAVCRQMDGILAHNHLGCFQGNNYKKKADYLAELGIPGLALLRDLVIDPRNDIEHAYELATEQQARRGYDVADLFLGATEKEAETPAIMAIGWNVNINESICTAPGKEHHYLKMDMNKHNPPMLLVHGYPEAPEVIILLPKEEVLRTCALREFTSNQVITLNTRLRECLNSTSFSSRSLSEAFIAALKDQIKL